MILAKFGVILANSDSWCKFLWLNFFGHALFVGKVFLPVLSGIHDKKLDNDQVENKKQNYVVINSDCVHGSALRVLVVITGKCEGSTSQCDPDPRLGTTDAPEFRLKIQHRIQSYRAHRSVFCHLQPKTDF